MHQYFLQLTNNKYFLAGSSSLLNETGGGHTSQIDQEFKILQKMESFSTINISHHPQSQIWRSQAKSKHIYTHTKENVA